MGIMDKLLGNKKTRLYTLTDVGQEKVENAVGDESKTRFIIMADLAEHGTSSAREIAERKGLDIERVKSICDILKNEGLIRTVSNG